MASAPPGGRIERERSGRGDRRCTGLQTRTPPPVPGAADNERRDEIREGLASYTGIAAWANSPADAHRAAASALAGGESQPAFVGNFEAASGPGYGVLLDALLPGWRRQVGGAWDLG